MTSELGIVREHEIRRRAVHRADAQPSRERQADGSAGGQAQQRLQQRERDMGAGQGGKTRGEQADAEVQGT